jgi:hypothetical protein
MTTRLKEVTKFRATDGREFDNQEEAIKHQIWIDVRDDEYDASGVSNVDLLEALQITTAAIAYDEDRKTNSQIQEIEDNRAKVRTELLRRLLGAPEVKLPPEIGRPN